MVILKLIQDQKVKTKNIFHENNLLNENQSGFKTSDSCEYQLLSIVHDIYHIYLLIVIHLVMLEMHF